ncbi:MAG: hypothetical protein LQ343_000671 [Gyalolechia ehrenbergii]|nr:MAG: hypothetical protein LQ343_000671 [Gyalolechia ehrenbergii]
MSFNVIERSIYTFPDTQAVLRGSLLDCSLVAIARDFDIETASSLSAINDLPIHLKEYLLSYIAAFRSEGITIGELRAIFANADNEDALPDKIAVDIDYLDLSHSIGSSISFEDLTRSFTFPFLTHLCLAHPGTEAFSWPAFLTFAEKIPHLTHLSLAYWPLPKAVTAASDLALHSLRRLSKALTKLQYLDVEGCNIQLLAPIYGLDRGPDWTGGWMHLHSLNLSQGPMPLGVQIEGGPETEAWIQGEVLARQVEDSINHIRKKHETPNPPHTLHVEHGPSANNFMISFLIDKAYGRCQPWERLVAPQSPSDGNVPSSPAIEADLTI